MTAPSETSGPTLRLNFLVYAPRSGSTWFAAQLAGHSRRLLVVPELRLPEFLLALGDDRLERLNASARAELFERDYQMANLGLASELVKDIAVATSGCGVHDTLQTLLASYAKSLSIEPEQAVIKLGNAVLMHRQIRRCVPDARFIEIHRDPRAVASSMIRTPRPYFPGQMMARGDVLVASRTWCRLQQAAREAGRDTDVLRVRYESLVDDTQATLAAVLADMGLGIEAQAPATGGFDVGAAERDIHRNIHKGALQRTRSWETELANWQGIAVEHRCRAWMAHLNYKPWFTPRAGRLGRAFALAGAYSRMLATALPHRLRELSRRGIGTTLMEMRVRLARRLDRQDEGRA